MTASFKASLASAGALEALVEGVGGVIPFTLPLLFPLLLILIQGVVGVRLERKADEFAVDAVGLDPALRAIDRLAELNQVRRRTGFFWNLMTQHPPPPDSDGFS